MQELKVETAPWWEVKLDFIGTERMPLVLIDNFYPEPQILIEDAGKRKLTANAPYFPGIRAAIPNAYFTPLQEGLSYLLSNIFQYKSGLELQEAHYSLTTTPASELKLMQCLPHVDGGNDMKLALLHYLCGSEHGGTSFYKQIRTGFETVSRQRFEEYEAAVMHDHSEYGPPAAVYFKGSDKRFEEIHHVEAKFNRAVMYFGLNLHAITIGESPLSNNPISGRLTINSFFNPL